MDSGWAITGFGKKANFSHRVPVNEWFKFRNADGRQTEANHVTWLVMVDCRPRTLTNHVFGQQVEGGLISGFSCSVKYCEE